MNRYEKTLINNEHIVIKETNHLPKDMKGLYVDGLILLKDNLSDKEKLEVLGEELAHHDITYGDILDTNELWKWKFEHKARRLGFEKIIPLQNIVQAYQSGVHNKYELSNYLDVSEGYVLNGASSSSKNYLDQEFAELLKNCTPEKQKLIYNVAKVIAETETETETE